MTGTATRYLYLVRHGEALPDESGLTENGRRRPSCSADASRTSPSRPFTTAHCPGRSRRHA